MIWKDIALDFLFPAYCVACGTIGSWFCAPCLEAVPLHDPACLICHARNAAGTLCNSCIRHAPNLTRAVWATSYDYAPIHEAIVQFKYSGNRSLASPLASCIVSSIKKRLQVKSMVIPQDAALLALPLHPQKRRERGFNQSELLARVVADELLLPLLPTFVLQRIRRTPPQAQVRTREERLKNVRGAFAVPKEHYPLTAGKTILLVDDITTTGSTLNDAARALKEVGAKTVWGVVVARG